MSRLRMTRLAEARGRIGPVDLAEIERRLEALDCQASAIYSFAKGGTFTVHVTNRSGSIREAAFSAHGPLAVILAGLVDNAELVRSLVDEDLADQVAVQSGMAVSHG